ncbi:MAG: DUF3267 domain-containing protein, partial [Saprospiraceae bacterium]|nr:DUF3267 domain-containing protein [Saprospiraceae bacterium]
ELTAKGYVLLDKLEHKELVPFIRTYMNKRTRFSIIYYLSNAIVFAITGYFFAAGYNSPDYSFGNRFTHFSYGLALAFTLLPLHEYIHVLAYKSQGAANTSYAANIKKMYFMALADKFVANKKEFQVVALAPFIGITTALMIAIFFVNQTWSLTLATTLLAHTAMCSGDFGLLSYFEYHKDKNVVTYDEIASNTSFFYGLARQTQKSSV